MHTNDTHANIDNVAKRITAIKQVRASHSSSLLLDAGDVFSGTLYFNQFKGLADLEFMNLVGYDAMTFGNHEFDQGTAVLADFVKDARFPFVSANVDFSLDANLAARFNDGESNFTSAPANGQIYNGIIKVVNGERVGIFGLTTAETAGISSPGAGVNFENYIAEAQKAVDAFKAQGVTKIIALTHLGFDDSPTFDNDKLLAAAVEGIDVIVGGHSHTKLSTPFVDTTGAEPTVIVQANEYSKFLGQLDVTFDYYGKVIANQGQLLDVSTYQEDAAAASILNTKYKPAVDAMKATVVGTTDVALLGGNPPARVMETNLGNLIADGMLAKAKTVNPNTVIALQNGGGVRVTLNANGEVNKNITLADIFTVLPFNNNLGILNLTGAEILTALEHSVDTAPNASGAFLQVAGLKYTYDSSKPVGERVQTVEVFENGQFTALDAGKNYYVATNIFTAKGGDNYTVFANAVADGRLSEPGFSDWEVFKEYLEALPNKKVTQDTEGRIIDVAAPTTVQADKFSGASATAKNSYYGHTLVDATGVAKLENAIVYGNLTIKGNAAVELNNVTVYGETIFVD